MLPIALGELPVISIRLTKFQRGIIRPGLMHIGVACKRSLEGASPSPRIPRMFPPLEKGKFSNDFSDLIFSLWRRSYDFLQAPGYCRFSLNFLEISAFSLAAGHLEKLVRLGQADDINTRRRLVRRRLLQALARSRKRAGRLAEQQLGSDNYHDLVKRWQMFAQWAGFWAFTEQMYDPRITHFIRESHRRKITWLCDVAKTELRQKGCEIPPDPELRKLVRAVIREGRRYRNEGCPFRMLLEHPIGREHLVNFITQHSEAVPERFRGEYDLEVNRQKASKSIRKE